jgi:hypothetical protein
MKKISSAIIFSLFLFASQLSFSQSFSFVNLDTTVCDHLKIQICTAGDTIVGGANQGLKLTNAI